MSPTRAISAFRQCGDGRSRYPIMCGINGALAFSNAATRVTEQYITCMRETMSHRGPDGAGVWVDADGRIGLGHRRLSIIDLSAPAGQPMSNQDDTLWIVYNG